VPGRAVMSGTCRRRGGACPDSTPALSSAEGPRPASSLKDPRYCAFQALAGAAARMHEDPRRDPGHRRGRAVPRGHVPHPSAAQAPRRARHYPQRRHRRRDADRRARPVSHRISVSSQPAPAMFAGGAVLLTVTVINLGTIHEQFAGPARLIARSGGQAIDFPGFIVLGPSTRVITADWPHHPRVCLCTAWLTTAGGRRPSRRGPAARTPATLGGDGAGQVSARAPGSCARQQRRRLPASRAGFLTCAPRRERTTGVIAGRAGYCGAGADDGAGFLA
jgi:hypothetical protein